MVKSAPPPALLATTIMSALGFDEAFDNRPVRGRCLPRARPARGQTCRKTSATSRAAGRPAVPQRSTPRIPPPAVFESESAYPPGVNRRVEQQIREGLLHQTEIEPGQGCLLTITTFTSRPFTRDPANGALFGQITDIAPVEFWRARGRIRGVSRQEVSDEAVQARPQLPGFSRSSNGEVRRRVACSHQGAGGAGDGGQRRAQFVGNGVEQPVAEAFRIPRRAALFGAGRARPRRSSPGRLAGISLQQVPAA